MNTQDLQLAVAFLNFVLCSLIGWACVCRINVMELDTTLRTFRAKYALLLTAATASGFSPFFAMWPTLTEAGMNFAFLIMMAGGSRAWRNGVPEYAQSDAAPLDQIKELR